MHTHTENEEVKKNEPSEEILLDFRAEDIGRGIRKFWWLCLVLALLGGVLQFYRSYVRFTPVWKVSATFTVQTQQIGSAGNGITSYSFTYNRSVANQLASTFPSIMKSNILQDIICGDLGLSYMPATLSASGVSGTNMFTMTASGRDPELTLAVLNSAIENYPAVAEYVLGNTNLHMLSEPTLPTEPSNRMSYRSATAKGVLAGLLLGALWIGLYAILRQTVNSRSDIRHKLNQHCLGTLPQVFFRKYKREIDRSVLLTNPMVSDDYNESFRSLRNSLIHAVGRDSKVILVTSTAPGEGKTTTAVNLAISLSHMGKRVLLADADLRNPSVNAMTGLSEPVFEKKEKPAALSFQPLPSTTVTVMNFNTAYYRLWQLIRVDYLKGLFERLKKSYDYIIVDTSPCGLTSETTMIAQSCDGALMVIRQDIIRTGRIKATLDNLLHTDIELLGCILNGVSSALPGYGYGYGYRYGYGRYGYGYGNGYGRYGKSSRRSVRDGDADPSSADGTAEE